jgi:hypothetical protein
MAMDSKQSNSSEVRFNVGRWKGVEKTITKKKINKRRFNNLLSQLRKKGDMKYNPSVREVSSLRFDFLRGGRKIEVTDMYV